MQKQFPLFVFVFIESLVVSAPQDAGGFVAMRFPAKITSGCIWLPYLLIELFYIGMPACGVDGRAYGHVITKISQMGTWPDFFRYGSTPARPAREWSSATNLKNLDKPNKLASVNQNVLLIKGLRIIVWYL